VAAALLLLALGGAAVPMAEAAPTPEAFRQANGEVRLDWAGERFMATVDGHPCSGRLDGNRSSLRVGGDGCALRLHIVGGKARGTLEVRSGETLYAIDAQAVPAHRAAPKPERQLTDAERRAQLLADRRASIERIKLRHRPVRGG
jgi:hypothetical protein